ncbi:MAG: hypothetical protein ABJG47_16380 [Ekhidna sp.]
MKSFIATIATIISIHTFAQENGEWRTIEGRVMADGEPFPAQSIIVMGTTYGTMTDLDGYFELQVPSNEIVFIDFVQCFTQSIREINSETQFILLKDNKKNRKLTNEAFEKWGEIKNELVPKVVDLYVGKGLMTKSR